MLPRREHPEIQRQVRSLLEQLSTRLRRHPGRAGTPDRLQLPVERRTEASTATVNGGRGGTGKGVLRGPGRENSPDNPPT